MSELKYYNTSTSQWVPIVIGATGYTGSRGAYDAIGFTGSKGDSGTPGTSVVIVGSSSTFSALVTPHLGNVGDGYILVDTGHLAVWTDPIWVDVGQITGYAGSVGYTGSTGTQGITGYTGSTGTQGEVGFTGSTGTQGIIGYTGSQGPGADQDLNTTSSVTFLSISAINTSFVGGAEIITTATIDLFASKTTIIAGTDTAVNTSTGEVTIWTTSTLQSVTDRGNSTTNTILIINTTSSTSTDTGALTVIGGVGIGGALYVNTTSFVASAEIITTGTIEQYAVTPTGIQTLTNKTIIVPSGGALYFDDDIALAAAHTINVPFKQVSSAPRLYTQSIDFANGVYWGFMGNAVTDATGLTPGDCQAVGNGSPPLNYTGGTYDQYYDLNTDDTYIWMPMSSTDLKPGDYYYDDVNQVLSICYSYIDSNTGLVTYGLKPFV